MTVRFVPLVYRAARNITSFCVTLRYFDSFVIQTALLETE